MILIRKDKAGVGDMGVKSRGEGRESRAGQNLGTDGL